eukprot:1159961-Pelagomonas_calceolata.AAC.6
MAACIFLYFITLFAIAPPSSSTLETPEVLEKIRRLAADNLQPTLNVWREMQARHGGKKLTMQHFLQTVREMSKTNSGEPMLACLHALQASDCRLN